MQNRFSISLFLILALGSCTSGSKATTAGKKSQVPLTHLSKEDQGKLDGIFLDAEKYKVIDDWDNAIKQYNKVLGIDPYNADAYFELAQISTSQNKLGDAEKYAMVAVKLDGSNKWYLEMLASIYMNHGKTKEAAEAFKMLVDKFPGNPDYYLNLAFLYSKEGQFDNAIKVYEVFEKNFGIDENVVEEKKNLYLRLNRFNDAMNEVHKLVDAFPGESEYLLMEADMYRANKMKDKAMDLYKQVLVTEPDNSRALLAMAELGMQGGNTAESNEGLKKIFENPKVDVDTKIKILFPYLQYWEVKKDKKQDALDLAEILTRVHPDQAKAFAVKADLYYLDGQNTKALEAYLRALALNKDVFQVWQQIMVIYNTNKDWTNLEKTCNDAVDLFPNQALIYLFKGGAEFQNKEYEKAVKSYTKGVRMSVDNDKLKAQFLSNLGDTYHSLNKLDESDSAYDQSLKLDPENAYVLNNYSYYLSLRKVNLEKAKQMSAYSNKLDPDNSSFLDTYAWILFQLNDFSGAKEWQEKAIKASAEKSGTILEHYGDILFKLGDKKGAMENWKKAKELGTDSGTIDKKISEERYLE